MSHYFINDPNLKSNRQELLFTFLEREYVFETDSGLFSKGEIDEGSLVLLKSLVKQDLGKRILDLGCGYGTLGVILKSIYKEASFDMVDINEKAVALAKENCLKNNADNNVFVSDGFSNIKEMYDTIITNPPIRAGKKVIYQMFDSSYEHLVDNGCIYVVMRKSHGALSAVKKLKSLYQMVDIIDRDKGFYIIKTSKSIDKLPTF